MKNCIIKHIIFLVFFFFKKKQKKKLKKKLTFEYNTIFFNVEAFSHLTTIINFS